ncbi:MAG: transcriptional regulator, partial [Clostridiales bacterium]|nr:transcriptional regulator [Clostridiales bacterium]
GTGIRRIFALYDGCPAKPEIAVTPNSFKLTLPNMNASNELTAAITPQMRLLLDCIASNQDITDTELQHILNIKKTRLYALISQMENAGFIRVNGRGKNKKYVAL